ncbi:MAG: hypothetical protein EKK36_05340 [Bradyrhizobiaceae bacterium]|nr:MAG: hypothetical protein EKK36_05340 [Bradyrhizobiaceae bacterium]
MNTQKSVETEFDYSLPEQKLFDLASMWLTVWAVIAVIFLLLAQLFSVLINALGLNNLHLPIWLTAVLGLLSVLGVVPTIFLLVMSQLKKRPWLKAILSRFRYIAVLGVALWLGTYYGEQSWRKSYDGRLREGAYLACAKTPSCWNYASSYADNH